MYNIFVALAIGMILLNLIWQLFKNYGLIAGVEAEDPVKLTIRSVLFILLAYFADEIVELILKIGGTPYAWIMSSELPALNCRLQFGHTYHPWGLRQRRGGSNRPDPRAHFGDNRTISKLLFEAAGVVLLLGVPGIHGAGGFCYGRGARPPQHLQAWCRISAPDISAADERSWLPTPVHHHGGNLLANPLWRRS